MTRRVIRGFCKSTRYVWKTLGSKPPRLVYIGGYLGYKNLGDEAVFEACKKIFTKYSVIDYPKPGGPMLSIPANLLKLFGMADIACLAGGTFINRSGNLAITRESVDIFRKVFVFGSGVSDPSFWSGKKMWEDTRVFWKPLLEKCKYIGVRGPRSVELLQEIGISNSEVIGDPVLIFSRNEPAKEDSYIMNTLGLNIGHSYENVWGSEDIIEAEFVKLATFAKKVGWKVSWFVVWPQDLEITRRAARHSRTDNEIHQIYENPYIYLDMVQQMSTFVGMKLHAVALATCAYVPSIMLEYQPKCRDYMQAIGQDTATIRTDCFKAEEVWEIIKNWISKRSILSNLLYNKISTLRQRQFQRADELFGTLGFEK